MMAQLRGIGDAAADVDVQTPMYPDNQVMVIQGVTVRNQTSSGDTVDVGVKIGSTIHWLETITMTTANLLYPISQHYMIGGGRRVLCRFKGTSDADVLDAYISGYLII